MNMALQLQKLFLAGIVALIAILGISLAATDAEAADLPQVVTVKTTINKGDIVNKSNLKFMDSRTSKISPDIITHFDDAANLEALRNLRPGMVLRSTFLRQRPLVRKNKTAKVVFTKPGIKLESLVNVLQDGNKGDIVKVKNLKSNQIVNAEVIGDNLVEVK